MDLAGILLDGRVGGIWSSTRRGSRLSVKIELFEKFSKGVRTKIEEEAASLGVFLERPCDLSLSK